MFDIKKLEYKNVTLIISETPTNNNIIEYIEMCKKNKVNLLIRTCPKTYEENIIIKNNLNFLDIPIEDGNIPNKHILELFFDKIKLYINEKKSVFAIHCVSGLGRACVFGCLILIDLKCNNLDSIDIIRKYRHGALNSKQLKFIQDFKKTKNIKNMCIIS